MALKACFTIFADMAELQADLQVLQAANTPVEPLDLQLLVHLDVINEIFHLFLPISFKNHDKNNEIFWASTTKKKYQNLMLPYKGAGI